jgi:hypothetical protein
MTRAPFAAAARMGRAPAGRNRRRGRSSARGRCPREGVDSVVAVMASTRSRSFDLRLHGPGRADADQRLRAVVADQFVGIDRQRRHPHARAVDGHAVARARCRYSPACRAPRSPARARRGRSGRPAGAIGIARHEHGLGDARRCGSPGLAGADMGGGVNGGRGERRRRRARPGRPAVRPGLRRWRNESSRRPAYRA